jgi:hypothetical protein
MEMNAQATKLQAAENDLKQPMADVTRAMEKAHAVAATAETGSSTSSRSSAHCDQSRRRYGY